MQTYAIDALVAQRVSELRALAAAGASARRAESARTPLRASAGQRAQQRLGAWLVSTGLGLMVRAG